MQTLYEMHKEAWDNLARVGMPEFGQLAQHFARKCDMDHALGLDNAVKNWANGRSIPSRQSQERVKAALAKLDRPKVETGHSENYSPPPPANPEPQTAPMLLITGTPEAMRKIAAVAKMLGCETVEV